MGQPQRREAFEMQFKEFKKQLQLHVADMLKNRQTLFTVYVDKDALWNTYLDSFPPGANEIFRERREYDCSCCRHFIKSFGNVVTIENNEVVSIWGFNPDDSKYGTVVDALAKVIKSANIQDVFITKEAGFGTDYNYEQLENGTVHTWDHFRVVLPKRFVDTSHETIGSVMGNHRTTQEVFRRSLEEISKDAIDTVLDLISQNSLYKGEEWKGALALFSSLHDSYHNLESDSARDCFRWSKSVEVGGAIGKIKNHSIGVLLMDISNGVDLDDAVRKYEAIVAPTNYKRPKAIFTQKMVEQAKQTLSDLGLIDSLGRRHSTIEDITVNNILYANKDTANRMAGDVFSELQKEVSAKPKSFSKVEEVPIDHFISSILPEVTSIEAFFENSHMPNLVSLIAPKERNSAPILKWSNNFSWAYNGNITDSMKERVKAAGGSVEGVLRFSIQWNENGDNQNDFDAHCVEPGGNEIFFSRKDNRNTLGNLDVDIINPGRNVAVENITWPGINRMEEGIYAFFVHNYRHSGGRSGFSAEIEYDGQIHSYEYNKELRQGEKVPVASLTFSRRDGIRFIKSLPSTISSKLLWNIQTNQFHPVSVCMFSPNYWDGQSGIGHKHYFFILNSCVNDTQPNGFFNEFLKGELMPHKRVFEALGSKMRVDQSNNQLSGIGFSSTKRNSLVCKVGGSFTRTIKITF
jgi:hypothetical protein